MRCRFLLLCNVEKLTCVPSPCGNSAEERTISFSSLFFFSLFFVKLVWSSCCKCEWRTQRLLFISQYTFQCIYLYMRCCSKLNHTLYAYMASQFKCYCSCRRCCWEYRCHGCKIQCVCVCVSIESFTVSGQQENAYSKHCVFLLLLLSFSNWVCVCVTFSEFLSRAANTSRYQIFLSSSSSSWTMSSHTHTSIVVFYSLRIIIIKKYSNLTGLTILSLEDTN